MSSIQRPWMLDIPLAEQQIRVTRTVVNLFSSQLTKPHYPHVADNIHQEYSR